VTDLSGHPETAGPVAEAPRSLEMPPAVWQAAETPEAALSRMLSERALLDVERPDLLAIAERNLFGPLPTEPARRQVVTRPMAQEQSAGKPAFRVSIGRLEIVAPPQVAPPQQPVRPRPEPKTSLQSYLDRRRQGRS
jgi:hypothetical protein